MTDVEPDDVAAMRRENNGNDFRAFMRQQIADGLRRRKPPAPPPPPRPPGHRPGAWPTGTSPPGPISAQPPGAWAAALERLRDGTDSESDPCECGACDTNDNNQPEEGQ